MFVAILYNYALDWAFRAFGLYQPGEEIQDIAFRLGKAYADDSVQIIDILILF